MHTYRVLIKKMDYRFASTFGTPKFGVILIEKGAELLVLKNLKFSKTHVNTGEKYAKNTVIHFQ